MPRVLLTCITSIEVYAAKSCARSLAQRSGFEIFGVIPRQCPYKNFPSELPQLQLESCEPDRIVQDVLAFGEQSKIDVIIPCLDDDVAIFAQSRDVFARAGIAIAVPDSDSLWRAMNKFKLLEVARTAGLPVVRTVKLSSESEIENIETLTYPIIAKPNVGYGGYGVLVYEKPPASRGELKSLIAKGDVLVQEYIPGGPGSVHNVGFLYDNDGRRKLECLSKSTRTKFPFGGPALAGVTVDVPEVLELGRRLMNGIGSWRGPISLEFKRHANTGEYFILDANPRIWGYSSLAEGAGLSFPYATVLAALGCEIRFHDDYLSGVRMDRTELGDKCFFSFSNGKTCEITRPDRLDAVALVDESVSDDVFKKLLSNSSIDAVVTTETSADCDRDEHDRAFVWHAPPMDCAEDLLFWVSHLFSANQVWDFRDGERQQYTASELWQSWWFKD